jgi:hypothetical protein
LKWQRESNPRGTDILLYFVSSDRASCTQCALAMNAASGCLILEVRA